MTTVEELWLKGSSLRNISKELGMPLRKVRAVAPPIDRVKARAYRLDQIMRAGVTLQELLDEVAAMDWKVQSAIRGTQRVGNDELSRMIRRANVASPEERQLHTTAFLGRTWYPARKGL